MFLMIFVWSKFWNFWKSKRSAVKMRVGTRQPTWPEWHCKGWPQSERRHRGRMSKEPGYRYPERFFVSWRLHRLDSMYRCLRELLLKRFWVRWYCRRFGEVGRQKHWFDTSSCLRSTWILRRWLCSSHQRPVLLLRASWRSLSQPWCVLTRQDSFRRMRHCWDIHRLYSDSTFHWSSISTCPILRIRLIWRRLADCSGSQECLPGLYSFRMS